MQKKNTIEIDHCLDIKHKIAEENEGIVILKGNWVKLYLVTLVFKAFFKIYFMRNFERRLGLIYKSAWLSLTSRLERMHIW